MGYNLKQFFMQLGEMHF